MKRFVMPLAALLTVLLPAAHADRLSTAQYAEPVNVRSVSTLPTEDGLLALVAHIYLSNCEAQDIEDTVIYEENFDSYSLLGVTKSDDCGIDLGAPKFEFRIRFAEFSEVPRHVTINGKVFRVNQVRTR